MSNITYIRQAAHGELVTVARYRERTARAEIGSSVLAIVASVVIMASLMAFRLWFLMPASFDFHN